MTVPYAFGAATSAIPLSQLDSNFNTPITLGNTAIQLGNTVTTLNNMTLANVTISSGNVTITNVTVTTANATTVNTTTLIATTANVTTGNVTNLISGNVSLTGGTITGTPISGSTGSFTTLTTSSTVTLNGGTAGGVAYLDGSKVLTSGSVLTFDGTNLGLGNAPTTYKFEITTSGNNGLKLNAGTAGADQLYFGNTGGVPAVGTVTASPLTFIYNGSEQMRLTSTGLGIGTSSPGTKLDVAGTAVTNNTSRYVARFSDTTSVAQGNGGGLMFQGVYTGTTLVDGCGIQAYKDNATSGNYAYSMAFATRANGGNLTEQMRLDSSGNLGIGTSSPKEKIDSRGAAVFSGDNATGTNAFGTAEGVLLSTGSGVARITAVSNGNNNVNLVLRSLNAGSAASSTLMLDSSGNLGLGVTPSAWDSTYKAIQVGARSMFYGIGSEANMANNAYYNSGYKYVANSAAGLYTIDANVHKWYNAASGTAGNAITFTQALTLDASGNLLAGKTSTDTGVAGSALMANATSGFQASFTADGNRVLICNRLTSDGTNIDFRRSGTTVGTISVTTTATAYNTSSDYRLKDNQQPLNGSGAFIDALKPKTWNWKSDGSRGVGFIAHEAQVVSPSSVVGEKDAVDEEGNPKYQAMEYGSAEFIANIIAELQSLRARVAALESNP